MKAVLLKRCSCGQLHKVGSLRDTVRCQCGADVKFTISNFENAARPDINMGIFRVAGDQA